MDALYTSVNRAWAGALYSTSQQCRQSGKLCYERKRECRKEGRREGRKERGREERKSEGRDEGGREADNCIFN